MVEIKSTTGKVEISRQEKKNEEARISSLDIFANSQIETNQLFILIELALCLSHKWKWEDKRCPVHQFYSHAFKSTKLFLKS